MIFSFLFVWVFVHDVIRRLGPRSVRYVCWGEAQVEDSIILGLRWSWISSKDSRYSLVKLNVPLQKNHSSPNLFFLHCENGDFSILMKDILSKLVYASVAQVLTFEHIRQVLLVLGTLCNFGWYYPRSLPAVWYWTSGLVGSFYTSVKPVVIPGASYIYQTNAGLCLSTLDEQYAPDSGSAYNLKLGYVCQCYKKVIKSLDLL